ncbi:MAG: molecular chaperone DnaK, partial [Bryobacteraceae bacterium]
TLKEHRDKVGETEAKNIEQAIEATKKAMAGTAEELNSATDKLTEASHKLAEAMYKASTPPPDAAGGTEATGNAGDSKKKDDVVDAEFVDVEDKK